MIKKETTKSANPNKKEKLTQFKINEPTILMDFLCAKMPEKTRTALKSLLAHKQVRIDGRVVTRFNQAINPGQVLTISSIKSPKFPDIKGLRIIYEDLDLIVVSKDNGITSISTNKENEKTVFSLLSSYVKQADPRNQIYTIHRLDKELSGILIFAKNLETRRFFLNEKSEVVLDRRYYAIVEGVVEKKEGYRQSWLYENKIFITMSSNEPNDGVECLTKYKIVKTTKRMTLLELQPSPDRKNQIRVHTADIGHPIVGDRKYGAKSNPINRIVAHAYKVTFKHPATREVMTFQSKMPPEFDRLIL
jgi:23S rRNA pseudouridine1911/1915/1917 synthase